MLLSPCLLYAYLPKLPSLERSSDSTLLATTALLTITGVALGCLAGVPRLFLLAYAILGSIATLSLHALQDARTVEKIGAAADQLKQSQQQLEELRKSWSEERQGLQVETERLAGALTLLQSAHSTLRNELHAADEQLEATGLERAQLQQTVFTLTACKSELQHEAEELRGETLQLHQSIEALSAETLQLRRCNHELERQARTSRRHYERLYSANRSLEARLAELNEVSRSIRTQQEQARAYIHALQQLQDRDDGQLASLKDLTAQLSQQSGSSQELTTLTVDQMARNRKELATSLQDLHSLVTALKSDHLLNERIERLRSLKAQISQGQLLLGKLTHEVDSKAQQLAHLNLQLQQADGRFRESCQQLATERLRLVEAHKQIAAQMELLSRRPEQEASSHTTTAHNSTHK